MHEILDAREGKSQIPETGWEELTRINNFGESSANNPYIEDIDRTLEKIKNAGYKVGPEYNTSFGEWVKLSPKIRTESPEYKRLLFETLPLDAQHLPEDRIEEVTSSLNDIMPCVKIPGYDEWVTDDTALDLLEMDRTRWKTPIGGALASVELHRMPEYTNTQLHWKLAFVKSVCHGNSKDNIDMKEYNSWADRVYQNAADGLYRNAKVTPEHEQWFDNPKQRKQEAERYKKMSLIRGFYGSSYSQDQARFLEKRQKLDEKVGESIDLAIRYIYDLAEGDFEAENLVRAVRNDVRHGIYDHKRVDYSGNVNFAFVKD